MCWLYHYKSLLAIHQSSVDWFQAGTCFRYILWLGHPTISLKCDQEPSTLALLEAVRKTCRCLGVKTIVETVAPGSHVFATGLHALQRKRQIQSCAWQSCIQWCRQASLLMQQLERGCGILDGTVGCQHPLYAWALLHAAWLHNRYVVRQGHTAYEVYRHQCKLVAKQTSGFLWILPQASLRYKLWRQCNFWLIPIFHREIRMCHDHHLQLHGEIHRSTQMLYVLFFSRAFTLI